MIDYYFLDWCEASQHYFNSIEDVKEYVLSVWNDLSEEEKKTLRSYKTIDTSVKIFEVTSKNITNEVEGLPEDIF